MGQYYHPTSIDKKQHVYSHDFGAGLKLMEHSYLEVKFMEAVEILLSPFGPWYKTSLVWAGDYAEIEEGTEGTGYEGRGRNLHEILGEDDMKVAPYDIELIKNEHNIDLKEYKYICNHSKKCYVNKDNVKEFGEGWKIHPLSLLTAEGNGQGGGDYYDNNPEYDSVGSWARDIISIEKEAPEGFTEETYNFAE